MPGKFIHTVCDMLLIQNGASGDIRPQGNSGSGNVLQVQETVGDMGYGSLVENTGGQHVWMAVVFGLLFLALTVIRVRQPVKFEFLTTSFFQGKSVIQPFKEGLIITSATSLVMLVNFFVVSGILLYTVAEWWAVETTAGNLELFGWLMGIVAAAYLIKIIINSMLQFILGTDRGLTEYRYNLVFFCHITGLILLPLVLILTYIPADYKPFVLWACFGFWGAMVLLRFGKTIVLGVRESVPLLYLFLYLCTLEILPLVVLGKLLIGDFSGLD